SENGLQGAKPAPRERIAHRFVVLLLSNLLPILHRNFTGMLAHITTIQRPQMQGKSEPSNDQDRYDGEKRIPIHPLKQSLIERSVKSAPLASAEMISRDLVF